MGEITAGAEQINRSRERGGAWITGDNRERIQALEVEVSKFRIE
jgi:hypothetical protein